MGARYFPVSLDVAGRLCVVIGGGHEALKKTRALLEAGARVHVVSRALLPDLQTLADQRRVTATLRPYASGDLTDAFLALACTDDPMVHAEMAVEAQASRVLLNVVDRPARCDFIMPAVVRQGSLTLAITTDGKSPAFAKLLQVRLSETVGPAYAEFLDLLGALRPMVLEAGLEPVDRTALFTRIVQSGAFGRLEAGDRRAALAIMMDLLKEQGLPWPAQWSTWWAQDRGIPI